MALSIRLLGPPAIERDGRPVRRRAAARRGRCWPTCCWPSGRPSRGTWPSCCSPTPTTRWARCAGRWPSCAARSARRTLFAGDPVAADARRRRRGRRAAAHRTTRRPGAAAGPRRRAARGLQPARPARVRVVAGGGAAPGLGRGRGAAAAGGASRCSPTAGPARRCRTRAGGGPQPARGGQPRAAGALPRRGRRPGGGAAAGRGVRGPAAARAGRRGVAGAAGGGRRRAGVADGAAASAGGRRRRASSRRAARRSSPARSTPACSACAGRSPRRPRCGDAALHGRALAALGGALVHAVRGRDEEGAVVLHEAIAAGHQAGDRATAVTAHRELGFVEVQAGRRAHRRRLAGQGAGAGRDRRGAGRGARRTRA